MTLPTVIVTTVDEHVTYDASEAIDQHFIVGLTLKGPVTPKRTFALQEWVAIYGGDVSYSSMYQAARTFFQEGGSALVTQRAVGPAPVLASSTASNAVPAPVIQLQAAYFGAYANAMTRQFVAGVAPSTVQLILSDATGPLLRSPDLASQAAIVAWCALTGIVTASALAGSGLPVVDATPVPFTGGTGDHVNITDTQYQAALNLLDVRLGPGQVTMPGRTTDAAHLMLAQHHVDFDRVALSDLPDSSSPATLIGGILDLYTANGAAGAAAFAPWTVTPDGFQVPPSAFVGAKISAMDVATGNPNQPAAGDNGEATWITGLTQDYTDAARERLNDANINVIHDVNGQGTFQLYGYRSLVSSALDPLSTAFSNARLDMLIRWKARKIGRSLLFQEIDGKGLLASKYNGQLTGMMKVLKDEGAVWDFRVDTDSVNNAVTATNRTLNARIAVQRSPFAEVVYLQVTNHQLTEVL